MSLTVYPSSIQNTLVTMNAHSICNAEAVVFECFGPLGTCTCCLPSVSVYTAAAVMRLQYFCYSINVSHFKASKETSHVVWAFYALPSFQDLDRDASLQFLSRIQPILSENHACKIVYKSILKLPIYLTHLLA